MKKLAALNSTVLNTVQSIVAWIKHDWASNRVRFIIEFIAWAISIACSVTMAITIPDPPLIVIYPLWITGCAMYAWAAWTRKSVGMFANYMLLTTIDIIGLFRLILS